MDKTHEKIVCIVREQSLSIKEGTRNFAPHSEVRIIFEPQQNIQNIIMPQSRNLIPHKIKIE